MRIFSVASVAVAAALNAFMASPNRFSLRSASPISMSSAADLFFMMSSIVVVVEFSANKKLNLDKKKKFLLLF